jgi:hypothetical protein
MLVNNMDLRVCNKRRDALKDSAVAELKTEAFYKTHINCKVKYSSNYTNQQEKIVIKKAGHLQRKSFKARDKGQ